MTEERSVVKNAGSEKQVNKGKRSDELRRRDELDDIRAVLQTTSGRRWMWRLMSQCGVFKSIWVGSAAIHYNSGQQDIGHWAMSEVMIADKDLFLKMQNENINQEGA